MGLGFRFSELDLGVWGLRFRFSGLDLGFGVKGFGIWLRVLGLVLRDLALGFWDLA